MNKTYYEMRQDAYLKAGAAMYNIASAILNDCTEPEEFRGTTYKWARDLATETARKAHALKKQAEAEGAIYRQPRGYNAAQSRYSEAVDRHLRMRSEYLATTR